MQELNNLLDLFYAVEEMHRKNDYGGFLLTEDYSFIRESVVDTILKSSVEKFPYETVRAKTSIPYPVIEPLMSKEVNNLNSSFLDPDCPFDVQGMSGLMMVIQGSFAKGFGYGVHSHRGNDMDDVIDANKDAIVNADDISEETAKASMQALMGGVDMDSLRVVAEIVSVVEAALVEIVKPTSYSGPLGQAWLWGFIAGWEFDNRKALANVQL